MRTWQLTPNATLFTGAALSKDELPIKYGENGKNKIGLKRLQVRPPGLRTAPWNSSLLSAPAVTPNATLFTDFTRDKSSALRKGG